MSLYDAQRLQKLHDDSVRIQAAFDTFSRAVSLPGGPSLAVQRHDPSWEAWKALCEAFASSSSVSLQREEKP